MIGKTQWFKRRKYGGWGLCPSTWQGWAYVGVMLAVLFGVQALPLPDDWKVPAMIVVALVFAADTLHIMVCLPKKDEREMTHEALAERNALWTMLALLCAGVGYQVASSVAQGQQYVDPVILVALIGAVIAKAITNVYLDRHN